MRASGRLYIASLVLLLGASPSWGAVKSGVGSIRRPAVHRGAATIDNATHMDANNLDMVVTNHGSYAYDLLTGNAGLIFPKGGTNTAVFASGPWIGAKVNGQTRVAIGEYSQEFVPGPMAGGTFQGDRPSYRNYKIERGNTTSSDYLNWPVADGAPTDSLGNPQLLGDVTIWSVYNDADPAVHNNTAGQTAPLGVEVQQTTFAFNRAGALGDVIFVRFKLINKGANTLDSTYFSLWSDPDLGGFTDDLVGCDTTLSLGYVYNATNADEQYGSRPPALGYDFFRGPIRDLGGGVTDTLGMTSFNKYINGTDPQSSTQTYNYMLGLNGDGTPVHVDDNPINPITTFQVPGDPVTNTGWLDSNPADRRLMLSSGPFHMAPGDSQEIVAAIIVGQGLDRLASITDLKNKDTLAQLVFDLDFDIPSPPPAPSVYVQPLDNGIRLVWGSEPVGTSSANINLNQDFHFQGIRVWQLASNSANANPTLLATYDVPDGVTTIYSDEFNPAKGKIERTLKMLGTDSGIPFSLDITDDKIRGGRLINNKEYFYAVTAYSYDLNNVAPYIVGLNQVGIISEVLESARKPISATPRSSSAIQSVTATQTSGNLLGGSVAIQQLAQNDITGHNYRVSFAPDESWTLRDLDTGQDLLTGETNLTGDFDYPVVDGFMPRVTAPNRGVARIFQQLANGDSVDLYPGKVDSSGVYYLDSETGDTTLGPFLFQDGVNPAFDNHDYEIRILPTASQNCWAYNFGDTSSVAPFLCPFEIYDLGACSYTDPSDDVKVTAMVRDDDASGDWTWGDRLYIRLIPYASVAWGNPATVSTDYVSDNSDQTLGRLGFILNDNSYLPNQIPPAETIRIRGGRFCVQDTFTFRSQKVGTAPGTIVKNDLNRIHAVPNPYYAHSQYELTQFDRVMKFTNIPASRKVTIRIFNLAGDLVRSIRREATTADQMAKAEIVWNLNTDAAVPVASGIYIFRIDVEGVGSKTDRLAVFVERERLDNF